MSTSTSQARYPVRTVANTRPVTPPAGGGAAPQPAPDLAEEQAPVRFHPAPLPPPAPPPQPLPALDELRADLLARAARLTQLRAEMRQAADRMNRLQDHAAGADAAFQTMQRRRVWGCGVMALTLAPMVVALIGRAVSQEDQRDPEEPFRNMYNFSLDYLMPTGLALLGLITGPSALRMAFHALGLGSAAGREQAAVRFRQSTERVHAEEQEYAQRHAAYRDRELPVLREAVCNELIASTGLPRVLAQMILENQDPDTELLRSAAPLPQRRVEIVVVG